MSEDLVHDPVDPDVDFERLKDATLGLAVIMVEAKTSPTQQTLVGLKQIQDIYDALSDGMLGYAWLRDEVVGADRGDSLLAKLEAGLADDEEAILKQLFGSPALNAD
ncbi:MAG: hypothetical protein ACRYFE_05465 [Janthinobacterium lividum]